jgi:hypothetical protein
VGGRTVKITLSANGTIILTPTIIQGNAYPLARCELRLTHKLHRARLTILGGEHAVAYFVAMLLLVGLEAPAGPRGHGARREGGKHGVADTES